LCPQKRGNSKKLFHRAIRAGVGTVTENEAVATGAVIASEVGSLGVGIGVARGMAGAVGGAAESGQRLVHLTGAGQEITESGLLLGRNGIYATTEATAARSGVSLTMRTGLTSSSATSAIMIPESAAAAFSRPIPIGVLSGWQRAVGTQYSAAGTLDLASGRFTQTGVNWNQVGLYTIDTVVTGSVVGITAVMASDP
jgi:hypothetical protein